MKNCNVGDCSEYNLGSELYKVLSINPDGTLVVEYYLVSEDCIRREKWNDVQPECLDTNYPITPEQFDKVAKAYQAAYDAAVEIMNSLPPEE